MIIINIKESLESRMFEMESIAKFYDIEPFDMYLLGGAACILGGYTERATRDFDFIEMGYPSNLGKVFAVLRDFDILEYESTLISPKYKERAIKLEHFTYLNVYLLSVEDIIVSKIIRLGQKDIDDINQLIGIADKNLINLVIEETLLRKDLFESKKIAFSSKIQEFRRIYNV